MSETARQAATGVLGLDELLHGGLPRNRLHLIEGEPGTGKTTLAMQFLLEGRRAGEAGLYVTLSETVEELNQRQQNLLDSIQPQAPDLHGS